MVVLVLFGVEDDLAKDFVGEDHGLEVTTEDEGLEVFVELDLELVLDEFGKEFFEKEICAFYPDAEFNSHTDSNLACFNLGFFCLWVCGCLLSSLDHDEDAFFN